MATLRVESIFVFSLCSFLLLNSVQSISEAELFTFGTAAGDSTLFPNDDEASTQQCLSVSFPFFGSTRSCLFVHNNGIITLSQRYLVEFIADPFPLIDSAVSGAQVIAPFWGDVDTLGTGSVRFRETDDSSLLMRARDFIHLGFVNHRNFDPTVLFVATWEEVGYFRRNLDKTNTFQCVLATDSQDLYVIFLYANIDWTTGDGMVSGGTDGLEGTPAQVGFNAGDQRSFFSVPGSRSNEVINITERSNVGVPGVWVFRVTGASVESGGCRIGDEGSQQTNIFPNYGTILGGDTISAQGCFTPDTDSDIKCRFDNVEVPSVNLSMIEVVCITPSFSRTGRIPFSVVVSGEERAVAEFTVLSIEQGHQVDITKTSSTDITLSNDDTITLQWDPDSLLPPLDRNQYRVDISLFELDLQTRIWEERKQFDTDIENDGSEVIMLRALQTVLHQDIAPLAIQVATSQNVDSDLYEDLISLQNRAAKWSSLFYFVKDDRTSRVACNSWYQEQSSDEVNLLALKGLPCPPRVEQARASNSGLKENVFVSVFGNSVYHEQKLNYFHPGARSCFGEMVLNRSRSDDSEQQCCYDNSGNLLIGAPGGGSIEKISPRIDHVEHIRQDIIPYIQCCKGDTPSCWKYYEKRPSDFGTNYDPPLPAWTYGDPHIKTLDGHQYTFNGRGEFIFVATNDNSFTLQGRMEPVTDNAMATVLTAVVAKEMDSDTVMFVRNRHLIEAYVNGMEINLDVVSEQEFSNVSLAQNSSNSVSAVFSSGVHIEVKVENRFISTLVVNLPRSYYGNTRGLMGVYNGDVMDDLTPNNAESAVSLALGLREIHEQFGITWIIANPSDSLFTYLPYQSFSTFYRPNYTPEFELDITNLDQTILNDICNGGYQCSYDVARTGDTSIGAATNAANAEIQRIVELSLPIVCNPPCQDGVCTANDTCTCALGYSGPTCSSVVVESCDVNPCGLDERCGIQAGSYVCVDDCSGNDTHAVCNLPASGPCSSNQCLNNGVCTPIITSSTSSFTCECHPGYIGDRCHVGINACRSDPCLNGGTCQVSSEDPNGYTCICPPDNTGVNCNETIIQATRDAINLILIVGVVAGAVVVLVFLITFIVLVVCCIYCATAHKQKFPSNAMLSNGAIQNGSMRQSTLVVSRPNPSYENLQRNSRLSINGNPLSRNSSTLPSSMPSSETLPTYSELDLRSTQSSSIPPVGSREFHQSMPSVMQKSPTPELAPHNILNTDANNRGNCNNNGNNTPTPSTNSNNSINQRQLKPLYQRSHEALNRRGSGPLTMNRQYLSPTNSLTVAVKGPGLRRHSYQSITYICTDENGEVTQATAV